MEKLGSSISAFRLFVVLVPGVLYLVFCDIRYELGFLQDDSAILLVAAFFGAVFTGTVISRIAELAVIPLIKKSFISKNGFDYEKFIVASENDHTLKELVENEHFYGSLIALLLACFFTDLYVLIQPSVPLPGDLQLGIVAFLFLLLFVRSFIGANTAIIKRVEAKSAIAEVPKECAGENEETSLGKGKSVDESGLL